MSSFSCPKCKKVLKTATPMAGKKIKCPGCAHVFAVPAASADDGAVRAKPPAPPRKPAPVPDDDDDERHTDPDEASPRQPGRARVQDEDDDTDNDDVPRRAAPKKAGSRKGLLLVVLVALVLGGVGFAAVVWPGFLIEKPDVGPIAKGKNKSPVTPVGGKPDGNIPDGNMTDGVDAAAADAIVPWGFAPANCDVVAGINVAGHFTGPQRWPQVEKFVKLANGPPEVADMIKSCERAFLFMNSNDPEKIVVVVKSAVPFDEAKVRKIFETGPAETVQGKTLYRTAPPNPALIALPDQKTLVIAAAPEAEFVKLLDGKGTVALQVKSQAAALYQRSAWVAVNLQGPLQEKLAALDAMTKDAPPGIAQALPAVKRARTLGVSLAMLKDWQVQVDLHCQNDQDATQVESQLKSLWETMAKPMLAELPQMVMGPSGRQEALTVAGAAVGDIGKSFQVQRQGPKVSISITVAEQTAKGLDKLLPPPLSQDDIAGRILSNNMKQIGLAMHNHEGVYKYLPQPGLTNPPLKGPKPLLSWRVALLPYLDEVALYQQFKLDEPWDSAHNKKLLSKVPPVFAPLGKQPKTMEGGTYMQMFVGPKTLFPKNDVLLSIVRIKDGSSNTILVAEAATPVPWTKPEDIAYDPAAPLPKLGAVSEHGFHVVLADASWRFIERRKMSDNTIRLAIDPADGMVMPKDW